MSETTIHSMPTRLTSALLLLMTLLLWPAARSAAATLNLVTVTIDVTNQAGTTNGQTLTVNGDTRTWTNSTVTPANQILTNNFIAGCTTNLYNQVSDNPFSKLTLSFDGTNGIVLVGQPGQNITATLSAGWGTATYLTNVLTPSYFVRVPIGIESAGQQTNIASLLISALDLSSNSLSGLDVALSNYVSMVSTQTVIGPKMFTNSLGIWSGVVSNTTGVYGIVGLVTNGTWWNGALYSPVLTNGINYGNAFSSAGTNTSSEQFGAGAKAAGSQATALGASSSASGNQGVALGNNANAQGVGTVAVGYSSSSTLTGATAVGDLATATAPGATALGNNAIANFTNSTAIGYNSQNTANNQVMLGSSGISVQVNNALNVGSGATFANGVTNLQHTGTNWFAAGADISFGRYALSTLANGNNAGVVVGTNVFVEVSGPSSAFTVNGLTGSPNRDGKLLVLLNRTGQNMTIANDSGVDATAANRIYCLTGADKSVTGNSAALLIYSGAATHWILLSFTQ